MQNGFIYWIFDCGIKIGKYFNLVEYFKMAAKFAYFKKNPHLTNDTNSKRRAANFGIDIFIVFKWMVISALWYANTTNPICTAIAWYLIVTNIFTYFYYHTWEIPTDPLNTVARMQRRFISVLLSMAFSIYSYAYLYGVPYLERFTWGKIAPSRIDVVYFSMANSFTVTYGDVSLLDTTARVVCVSQLTITFIFVLIVSSAVSVVSTGKA